MRLKFWGTRGSLLAPMTPAHIEDRVRAIVRGFWKSGRDRAEQVESYLAELPTHHFGGYGGDTLCLEVSTPAQRLIVDAGSGLRRLGYELTFGPCGCGRGEVHILFTHFHWDHLLGLPFFVPIFIPGNVIHVYAVQPDLPHVFHTLFQKPFFPLTLEQLGATLEYHQLAPREPVAFGDITVMPYQLDHPDPCWGYKFESAGKTISHCVDSEIRRITRGDLGPDLPLYQQVDLMIMDAQYTLLEAMEKVNWGHGSAATALDIAMREGVKRVLFIHHDPAASDEKVAAAKNEAKGYYENLLKMAAASGTQMHEVAWDFVGDGFCVDL